jgi:hypothetical protein
LNESRNKAGINFLLLFSSFSVKMASKALGQLLSISVYLHSQLALPFEVDLKSVSSFFNILNKNKKKVLFYFYF